MMGLSADVWSIINSHLSPMDVLNLGRVSRHFRAIHRSERAWAIHRKRLNISGKIATWRYFARFTRPRVLTERLLIAFGKLLTPRGRYQGREINGLCYASRWKFSGDIYICRTRNGPRGGMHHVWHKHTKLTWRLRRETLLRYFDGLLEAERIDAYIEAERMKMGIV